ncbi:uncharacterized protein [Euwallacea fornicatus]|uniref:uncharacterized protein n=1 Tax=Euwallacea fornicatus TaxID=995702 RepID=UPI00339054A8
MTTTKQPFIKLTTKPPNTFATIKKFVLKMQPQKPYSVQVKQPYFKSKTTQITTIKKPVYRQTNVRSHVNLNDPQFNTKQAITKSSPFYISIPVNAQLISAAKMRPTMIKNVEISPQQASTEREPEIHTSNSLYSTDSEKFNNKSGNQGFKPESIIVERGFKPIIGGILETKVDEIDPEVDPEGESGVIKISGAKKLETFYGLAGISLPTKLKFKKAVKNPIAPKEEEMKLLIVHPRNLIDSDIEPEMAAADRVESYYLPPPGQTETLKNFSESSEIDFEAPSPPEVFKTNDVPTSSKLAVSPPDTVVTFDGKTVSGASLTAKPFEKSFFLQRGSKATEFLKAHPQSVPFRGELPPLSPNVLFNANPVRNSGVLNRNLDTPLPPTGTTKLRRL